MPKTQQNPDQTTLPLNTIPHPSLILTAKQFWTALSVIVGLILSATGMIANSYVNVTTSVNKIETSYDALEKIQAVTNTAIENSIKRQQEDVKKIEDRLKRTEDKVFK